MNRVIEVKGIDPRGESRVTAYYTADASSLARWLLHNGWKYAQLLYRGRQVGCVVLDAESGHRVCRGDK